MRVARPTIELPLDELLNAEMEEEEHDHDAGMLGLYHSSNEESDSASASGSGSGRDEEVAARMGTWSSLGMGTGMEMGVGWDEIMRGAQAGFGPFYNEWVVVVPAYIFLTSPLFFFLCSPTTTATGAPANAGYEPLTLDPHAAFGFHHKRANNEKANSTTTPTLSPNAYFLQELDEVCGFFGLSFFCSVFFLFCRYISSDIIFGTYIPISSSVCPFVLRVCFLVSFFILRYMSLFSPFNAFT
jgi:hypothetical protein